MAFYRPSVALGTALLCACMPAVREPSASNSTVVLATAEQAQVARRLSFVEAQCSGCHALRPGVTPPNPQAPSFVAVANDMGFNQETLSEFFRDGHDTPAAMSLKLDEDDAEMATTYIMSLRSPQ